MPLSVAFRWSLFLLERKFADVRQMEADDLRRVPADRLALFDCRPPAERAVSRIAGSVPLLADCDGAELDELAQRLSSPSDGRDTVVCYCSMGYRSSVVARRLRKRLDDCDGGGAVNVYNLRGGLFHWANERMPMIDAQGDATQYAHPFSHTWGRFLHADLWKWGEDAAASL